MTVESGQLNGYSKHEYAEIVIALDVAELLKDPRTHGPTDLRTYGLCVKVGGR